MTTKGVTKKKPAANKGGTKKVSAKKTAAKRPAVKKAAVKKATPKKAASRKAALKKSAPFALPSVMDITTAEEVKQSLLGYLKKNNRADVLMLNGAEVVRLTTPCIQVMLAAERSMQEVGGVVILQEPSEAIACALKDLGLQSQLEKWKGEESHG